MNICKSMAYGVALALVSCSVKAPDPYGALPSQAQIEWQKMETNMFVHFGPNTFTSAEWGTGKESADIFNPTDLDCRQWVRTAKAAGMKGVIITAKHHDGFCLWPNPVSGHTVSQSAWRNGKGDVLKDLSDACREYGLKFGVYISPWDRNDPHYGTDEYNSIFCKTLESALTGYGEVFEQWFDGACGEGPTGKKQVYDWTMFNSEVFRHQPSAIIFSNVGPGCRWVGNEYGSAGRTCWSTLDTEGYTPSISMSIDTLNCGNAYGSAWVPAETDVSIRPGWFYRGSENDRVKSTDDLLKIWYESVGRNSLLLLNVPADKRGHIHEIDSVRLMEFRTALDSIQAVNFAEGASIQASEVRGNRRRYSPANLLDDDYDSYWAVDDNVLKPSVTLTFDSPRTFNRVMLQEYIPLGQRVAAFSIEVQDESGNWTEVARETTIGYKRIILIPETVCTALRVNITDAHACPVLNKIALYQDNVMGRHSEENLPEGSIHKRNEPQTLDLGSVMKVLGFRYAPIAKGEGGCIITCRIEVSSDGINWSTELEEKMFDNIVNNPVMQTVDFPSPVSCRYIRLTPLRTATYGCETDTYGLSTFSAVTGSDY